MADINKSKLLKIETGILHAEDACIVLVKTEWNAHIVDELERGCMKELQKWNVKQITSIIVPGAVEISFAIKNYWEYPSFSRQPDAFIALGCVVRGDTPHFDYVCKAVTDGIVLLNHHLPVPTIFGVLTVDNELQANERIGGAHGHKGVEAAMTALKMISMQKSFKK